MRTLIGMAVLAAFSLAANAAEVPVSGIYGTIGSCAHTNDVDLLIGPTGIGSLDLSCIATKVRGTHVTFACELEGNQTSMDATISEDVKAGTVNYSDEYGNKTTLHRCP